MTLAWIPLLLSFSSALYKLWVKSAMAAALPKLPNSSGYGELNNNIHSKDNREQNKHQFHQVGRWQDSMSFQVHANMPPHVCIIPVSDHFRKTQKLKTATFDLIEPPVKTLQDSTSPTFTGKTHNTIYHSNATLLGSFFWASNPVDMHRTCQAPGEVPLLFRAAHFLHASDSNKHSEIWDEQKTPVICGRGEVTSGKPELDFLRIKGKWMQPPSITYVLPPWMLNLHMWWGKLRAPKKSRRIYK